MRLPSVIFGFFILLVLVLVLLAGCTPTTNLWDERDYNTTRDKFQMICLEGVEYWIRAAGNKAYMAPRIDSETLQPRRCNKT